MSEWRRDSRTASRVRFGAVTRLEQRHSTGKRIFLGIAGLLPLLAPIELWRGLWPLTWATPFFAVIVLGALSVAGFCILGSIFGYDQRWTIAPGRITVQRRSPFRRARRMLHAADIVTIEVIRHDWSDGEPSFAVALRLKSGERLEGPSVPDAATAERIRDEMRRQLPTRG